MAEGTQVGPRFDADTIARIDAIVAALNEATPGHKIDRAGVVRVAVLMSLPELEARHQIKGPAKGKRGKR